jgi:hypothetical protein
MDIARSLLTGTRPRASLVLQRPDPVGAIAALLPGKADDAADRQGPAGKPGARETIDLRPFLISPVEDTLLGPAGTRKGVPPALDLNGGSAGASGAIVRRGDGDDAEPPLGDSPSLTERPSAQRLENDLALVVAIALLCPAIARGTRRSAGR